MLHHRNAGLTLSFAAFLALLFATDASAYLDPGTGSMVVQTVIAALAPEASFKRKRRRILEVGKPKTSNRATCAQRGAKKQKIIPRSTQFTLAFPRSIR